MTAAANELALEPFDNLELALLDAWRSEADLVAAREIDIGHGRNEVLVAARAVCGIHDKNYLDARYTVPLNEKLANRRVFCQRLVADSLWMIRQKQPQRWMWDITAEFFDGNRNGCLYETEEAWISELGRDRRTHFRTKYGSEGRAAGIVPLLTGRMHDILLRVQNALEREGLLIGRLPGVVGEEYK